ncbi:MAG: hypothetical protein JJ992_15485, partial [Planctomycetes bacterium]|nr:hypothetical protein [Planctomycetota bacterium]
MSYVARVIQLARDVLATARRSVPGTPLTEKMTKMVTSRRLGAYWMTPGLLVFLACTGIAGPEADKRDDVVGDTVEVDSPALPAVSIQVDPRDVTLLLGDSIQFESRLLDEVGNLVSDSVAWFATGGSISAKGKYKAGKSPGKHTVIVRGPRDLADTASVTISGEPPRASGLTVSPDHVTVEPNGTRTFVADLRDQYGDPISDSISWEATGGMITNAGAYTAGAVAGGYRVIARGPDGLADTASVTITSTPTGGEIRYVDAQAGSDSNNGLSQSTPMATLGAATASLPATGGGLRLKGTFSLNSPWVISKPIDVGTYGQTTIEPDADMWTLIHIDDVDGVSIRDVRMRGTAGSNVATDLIRIYDSSNLVFNGLDLGMAPGSGVAGGNVHDLQVLNSSFQDLGLSGVRADDSGPGGINSHWRIADSRFERIDQRRIAGHAAVQSNGFSLNEWFWVERNVIENSEAGTVGIGLDAVRHAWVTDNYIRGSGEAGLGEGIAVTGQDIVVARNEVLESAAAGVL